MQLAYDSSRFTLRSRRWDAILELGDAYLRIGDATRARDVWRPKARQAYLMALMRAHADRSFDGIVQSGQRFAGLGDRDIVEQCVRLAQHLVGAERDPRARDRLRVLTDWLTPDEPVIALQGF